MQLYRQLAQADPQAFLPNLAISLTNLANAQSGAGDQAAALETFEAAARAFTPGPAAHLLLTRAFWRISNDDLLGGISDPARASELAAAESDPEWAGRARRSVQAAVQQFSDMESGPLAALNLEQLPGWTRQPLPADVTEALNAWLAADSWDERESVLRRWATTLTANGSATIGRALFLYPDIEALHDLSEILTEITQRDLDMVLTELRSNEEQAELIREWLNTATWTASRDFLRQHPTLATDPRTAEYLQALPDDPVIDQHLAILQLAETMPLDDVYDAVIDPTMAVDTAMAAVETGDTRRIFRLLQAVPDLTQTRFVAPYLAAALTILTGVRGEDAPNLDNLIAQAAEQGTDTQRQAGAARLRRLARRLPDSSAALEHIAASLTTAAQTSQVPGRATDAG